MCISVCPKLFNTDAFVCHTTTDSREGGGARCPSLAFGGGEPPTCPPCGAVEAGAMGVFCAVARAACGVGADGTYLGSAGADELEAIIALGW